MFSELTGIDANGCNGKNNTKQTNTISMKKMLRGQEKGQANWSPDGVDGGGVSE